mmetsp:Transcript_26809/g.69828  ORF Transcript_26809/g.69828 Transcript_26809/m.69828 type:complete len:82 (+) Transcript_26809:3-248(+)
MQGKGQMDWPTGDVYEGEFEAGARTGEGTWMEPRGAGKFRGTWLDGKKHGKGVNTDADGRRSLEEWDHGELVSSADRAVTK